MKEGYSIENRGIDNPATILVFNWHHRNEVDNVRHSVDESYYQISMLHNLIAIFRIKYKNPLNHEQQ